jgi:hypothetical protein
MNEVRIRAASAANSPAIAQIVEQAHRHYILRIGKPPGPDTTKSSCAND